MFCRQVSKFTSLVSALGPETIEAIARAGPELQAKMLEGLGLQGFLVTDGSSPINLFNTAQVYYFRSHYYYYYCYYYYYY
jgi:major vault protein